MWLPRWILLLPAPSVSYAAGTVAMPVLSDVGVLAPEEASLFPVPDAFFIDCFGLPFKVPPT